MLASFLGFAVIKFQLQLVDGSKNTNDKNQRRSDKFHAVYTLVEDQLISDKTIDY